MERCIGWVLPGQTPRTGQRTVLLGQFDVRLINHIGKKSKETEGVEYKDFSEILAKFVSDVGNATNVLVEWKGLSSSASPAAKGARDQSSSSTSIRLLKK